MVTAETLIPQAQSQLHLPEKNSANDYTVTLSAVVLREDVDRGREGRRLFRSCP